MSRFLTTASVLQCAHGGTVIAASGSSDTKAGAPVLRPSDTFSIAGCGNSPTPCVKVDWPAPGGKTKVAGEIVLRESDTGLCKSADQAVQCPVVVSSTQALAGGG